MTFRSRSRRCLYVALLHLALHGRAIALQSELSKVSRVDGVLREGGQQFSLGGCSGVACLEQYVAFNDSAFSWTDAGKTVSGHTSGVDWTSHRLEMTSQTWMPKATRLSAWRHRLEVVIPKGLTARSKAAGWAVLIINEDPSLAYEFAARTGLVAVTLSDTPPQFMHLASSLPLFEEVVKANSWAMFAEALDKPWPIELPTVKAVVRAMDAVAEFTRTLERSGGVPAVASFAVTGWSKRAVATYMAGAIDPRIKIIVPVSHPVNLDVQGRDSFQNLGETVSAAKVYDMAGVYKISGPTFAKLESLIDPVSYLDRLTMPKLVTLNGRDGFFAPDSTRTWWGKLPSPKSFFMFPNHGHDGFTQPIRDVATSFIAGTVHQKAMPMIDWTIDGATGDIAVRQVSDHTPLWVSVWSADTPTRRTRDFRSATYVNHTLSAEPGRDGRSWVVRAPPPKEGWRAIFAEFVYEPVVPLAPNYKTSTEVSVVPSERPFAPDPKRANYVFR